MNAQVFRAGDAKFVQLVSLRNEKDQDVLCALDERGGVWLLTPNGDGFIRLVWWGRWERVTDEREKDP